VRCVLDPNVIVSALLSRQGTPAELLRLWLDGSFELVASPLLLAELKRVLAYPKIRARVSEAEAEEFLALLNEVATVVDDPDQSPSVSTADSQDDYLVALAEDARAVIVSGDKHLLDMAGQLPVYPPADFRNLLTARENR
jgi:putative PIN family toxin of toxin-antitoxin system